MEQGIEGSCLCGKVRFRIAGEFQHFFLCHCARCRKDTGSAHAANLFSTTARLSWVSGTETVKTFRLAETRHQKSFCSECGSALPGTQENGTLLVVPAGCLDMPVNRRPDAHIFCAGRAGWDQALAEVPELPGPPG